MAGDLLPTPSPDTTSCNVHHVALPKVGRIELRLLFVATSPPTLHFLVCVMRAFELNASKCFIAPFTYIVGWASCTAQADLPNAPTLRTLPSDRMSAFVQVATMCRSARGLSQHSPRHINSIALSSMCIINSSFAHLVVELLTLRSFQLVRSPTNRHTQPKVVLRTAGPYTLCCGHHLCRFYK